MHIVSQRLRKEDIDEGLDNGGGRQGVKDRQNASKLKETLSAAHDFIVLPQQP